MADLSDQVYRRFQQLRSRIRRRAVAGALRLWAETVNGPDDDTAGAWIEQAVPLHRRNLGAMSQATDAYVSAYLATFGIDVPGGNASDEVRATPAEERLMRPIVEMRARLADGLPFEQAMDRAETRLRGIAETDAQLAYRDTFRRATKGVRQVSGYRRVLTGSESCGLCVLASSQRYKSDELMPIHPGCDCGIRPFVGDVNRAGGIVDEQATVARIDEIAAEHGVDTGDRAQLFNTLVEVQQHGDMGPTLTWSKHRTTGKPTPWVRKSRREFNDQGELIRG